MGDLWVQGLQLTVLGMGMTFAAIGALVIGMYVMTAVTRTRRPDVGATRTDGQEEGGRVSLDGAALESETLSSAEKSGDNARYRAAVAAVAVALAEAGQRTAEEMPRQSGDVWDLYVRGRHLSRRMRYDLRQRRR